EPPVTVELIYKALHVLDPESFPSDTAPADLKLDTSKIGEGQLGSPAAGTNDKAEDTVTSGETKDKPAVHVEAPGPTQEGINKACKKWHVAKATDSCHSISEDSGVTLEKFYSWNPAVNEGGECMELWIGYAVCIGDAL